jgi:sulfide:quinone oxidoreductase
MNRFRVVICGGGVAALEAVVRLRKLAGDVVDIKLVAPNTDFAFRALAVKEPFGFRLAERYPLERIARDMRTEWVQDKLAMVDHEGRVVRTEDGRELSFDALLLAIGAELSPAFEHVTTFRDAEADAIFSGIVADVEEGYLKSVAFVVPDGRVWPLPLYELALMTAERAYSMGIDDIHLSLVTPEPMPLAAFGPEASVEVYKLLSEARVHDYCSAWPQVPAPRRLIIRPGGEELNPQRIVAMPRVSGPSVRGIPGTADGGFIPIDPYCAVPDAGGRVFAAGDATNFPVKHGGLAAQEADTAAAAIARLAGADVQPRPLRAELFGILLTGRQPLYLKAHVMGGQGFDAQVSQEPLWTPADKVAADELVPYLERLEATA